MGDMYRGALIYCALLSILRRFASNMVRGDNNLLLPIHN